MKTVWLKDVKEEKEKEQRRVEVISAHNAFKVLTGILEEKIKVKETERNSAKCYELPSYAAFQADASGYIRALREIQSIIDIQGGSNV